MPRQRPRSPRTAYDVPDDFAGAFERLKEASGLTWTELARQLGTTESNVWRWRNGVVPNTRNLLALQDLARRLGVEHLLPTATARERR